MKKVFKIILFVLLIISLIFIQMLFYKDFDINKSYHINCLYIFASLLALVSGFITGRYYTLNLLSLGETRKNIYLEYLKKVFCVLGVMLLVYLVYMFSDLIIYKRNSFADFFNFGKLIYFVSCYTLFASLGYFQGIVRLKQYIALIIMITLTSISVLIEVLGFVRIWISLIVLVLSGIMMFINSKLIYKINILD